MGSDIQISNLRKKFGGFTALNGIDLTIAEGEVVCVIGPSGSGKSTLIRCINLLERFEADSLIRVGGVPVEAGRNLEKVRADVGMVFQSFNLFPHLTVLRNVMLAPMRVRNSSSRISLPTAGASAATSIVSKSASRKNPDRCAGACAGCDNGRALARR